MPHYNVDIKVHRRPLSPTGKSSAFQYLQHLGYILPIKTVFPVSLINRTQTKSNMNSWRTPFLILSLCLPAALSAQIAVDKLEVYLVPAKTSPMAEAFAINNEGKDPMQISLSVQDWDRAENGNNRFFPQSSLPGSCGRALSVFPEQLRLAPGETQQVRISVALTDTLQKPCWGIIFAQTVPPKGPIKGRSITYILRTGVKVYVHPSKSLADGAIDSMAVTKTDAVAATHSTPSVPASNVLLVRFQNTGTRHIQTTGHVELRNSQNVLLKTIDISEFPTLPGARRVLELPLPSLTRGHYVALAVLDFHGPDSVAGQFEFDIP